MPLKDVILNIANITNLICTLILAFNFQRLKSFGRIVFFLFLGNTIADISATLLIHLFHQTTLSLYYIWFSCIVIFMFWLYNRTPGPLFKNRILRLLIAFTLGLTIYGAAQDLRGNSLIWPMNVLTIFLLITSYIMLRYFISEGKFNVQNPMHWLIVAYTAYSLLNIQAYAGAFYFYMQKNLYLVELFYSLNIIGYMSFSIITCYAILKSPRYELA